MITSQSSSVPECSHLRIREPGEQGDDVVHEVLVVDDGVLAHLHQCLDELTEIGPKLLPCLPCHDQRVFATFLDIEEIINKTVTTQQTTHQHKQTSMAIMAFNYRSACNPKSQFG